MVRQAGCRLSLALFGLIGSLMGAYFAYLGTRTQAEVQLRIEGMKAAQLQGSTPSSPLSEGPPTTAPLPPDPGTVAIATDFVENTDNWPESDTENFFAGVVAGHYEMRLKTEQRFATASPDGTGDLTNVSVYSDVQIDGKTGYGGVMVRYNEDSERRNFYQCWIANTGKYG